MNKLNKQKLKHPGLHSVECWRGGEENNPQKIEIDRLGVIPNTVLAINIID